MSNTHRTNAKSSQSHIITTTEMCAATISKVSFDRVQSEENPSHLVCQTVRYYLVSSVARHFIVETVELRAHFAASSARSLIVTSETNMTWYPNVATGN